MRAISLHDTGTGEIRQLDPAVDHQVRIYVCGPTVYGRIHVGNARPFVVFSLLKRFLASEGYKVDFVANITDVNDKIYGAALSLGIASAELAREMTAAYIADTDALGLGRPDHEPRASETIGPMEELIEQLIEGGHAYPSDGDVYFSVRGYPSYGEISHRRLDEMDQGEPGEGAGRKRDPLDFALWKGHKEGEDTWWDSPWGRGRPGWHIECSAMAEQLLGLEFEIHGGGSDLLFPHHENEAAQTRAARGRPLARMWMHNGMVRLDSDKMSKSVGNVFVLHEALERYGRDALLMYFCGAHYRQPVEFNDERLEEAQARCDRIREAARGLVEGPSPEWSLALHERFLDALANDFNTPRALAAAFEWVREANRNPPRTVGSDDLRAMLDLFGLANLLDRPRVEAPPEASALLEERERARAARDFETADRLRDQLRDMGWIVRDSPDGPELLPDGMIVYGRNPVWEAIRGPRTVKRIWATGSAAREPWLEAVLAIITVVDAHELERLCKSPSHQGICAEVSPYRYAEPDQLLALEAPLLVCLDQVQDPQNLGAVARSAECAGAAGLVISERRSADVTPAVCKASAGAVEHLPVARVRNLADFLGDAKRAAMWCYGADAGAPTSYEAVDFTGGTVLVLGSEGRGLRPRVAAACDLLVSIPLRGRIESLSVSAAAAVLVFAAAQRQGNLQRA